MHSFLDFSKSSRTFFLGHAQRRSGRFFSAFPQLLKTVLILYQPFNSNVYTSLACSEYREQFLISPITFIPDLDQCGAWNTARFSFGLVLENELLNRGVDMHAHVDEYSLAALGLLYLFSTLLASLPMNSLRWSRWCSFCVWVFLVAFFLLSLLFNINLGIPIDGLETADYLG